MKRLSKDERVGATVLALIALLICGGSLLLRHGHGGEESSEMAVKSIVLAADSVKAAKKERAAAKVRKDSIGKNHRGDSIKKAGRGRYKNGKTEKRKRKEKDPTRDILSEPIPQ